SALSARVALRSALSTLLRLFAPFLPYATEEVWSWCGDDSGRLDGLESASVHRAPWPVSAPLRELAGRAADPANDVEEAVLAVAADVLSRIRKAKSDAKASMRAEVSTVTVTDNAIRIAALELASGDVRDAGKVAELLLV